MTLVAITQRVEIGAHDECRDCLDQRWHVFLQVCGITALMLPNHPAAATALVNATSPAGLILTGGNDLERFGGDTPERDATERATLEHFLLAGKPVLGICRGMQFLADFFGSQLAPVAQHVSIRHKVRNAQKKMREVNSAHHYGVIACSAPLKAFAWAEDGSVEGMRHENGRLAGIMWHPEREAAAHAEDVQLFRELFQ